MSRYPNNPPRKHTGAIIVMVVLMILFIAGSALMIKLSLDLIRSEPETVERPDNTISLELPEEVTEPTTEPTEPDPVPESVVSTATIGATGDLLMHLPVINSCRQSDGSFNFDEIFQYLQEYSSTVDYAAANLETTLFGTGKAWSGFPNFNCPDSIVDGVKNAGFDMLLTGNNHSFDTGKDGYLRTIEVVQNAGLEKLGTMTGPEDAKWTIQDINGIKVGMLSYTYETTTGTRGEYPALNGLPMYGTTYEYINCFRMNEPEPFLEEVKGYLAEMKEAGAEATIMFMHWGVEYQTKQNSQQDVLAQGLCDLGIDVVIGGHPHVVQPVQLLTSTTDPDHKTVCLYSMGNAVSNQRTGLSELFPAGYTEDGVFFSVTFEKYSDGKVYMVGADLIPTWVNLRNATSDITYAIIPLDYDRVDEWGTAFDMNENVVNAAKNSHARTMGIVGEGLTECQNYLAEQKIAREEYYYNLAWHPEMFETQPTEAVPETIAETTAETTPETLAPAA